MNKEIDISIIMSTCNTEIEFLDLAIRSILTQNYSNFEFIIVNDGGDELPFLEKIDDERIVIINHDRTMGLPFSLNQAIDCSRGKYIARMDSDDISYWKRLDIQKKFMDKNNDIDLCAMFYKRFGKDDANIVNVWNSYPDVNSQLFFRNVLAHPSVMFRKKFLIENNLKYSLDFTYSQDFELWTRCAKIGKIAIIPKLGLYYRTHNKQISSSKKQLQKKLYESTLTRNLKELEFSEKDLKFLKMLNDNSEEKLDFCGLSTFIDNVLKNNDNKKIYDAKSLKKVLYNMYFILNVKNKRLSFKLVLDKKDRKKILKIYNLYFILKKIYYTLFLKLTAITDNKLKNIR